MHVRRLTALFATLCAIAAPLRAATSARGMVAAEHELAARAGAAILAEGGNAVDAAVAAAFVTGVVNPSSCGIGGGGFLLVHDGRRHELRVLDFRETAPAAATASMYVREGKPDPRLSLRGGLAVAVPGEVRGLARALADLGTLPLARVLAPAIEVAAGGFPVGSHLAAVLREGAQEIRLYPDLARIYLRPDGEPLGEGERLVQTDLAKTLSAIAERGPDAFYRGAIADRIAAAVRASGGILTAEDLRRYEVRERKPLAVGYRGLTVAGVPPPSSGGGVVLEILNVLAGFDLRGAQTPQTLHRIAEAEKLAFADRAHDYGDPDFVPVPIAKLLSPGHADELRARIRPLASASERRTRPAVERGGTSHLSVMDARGGAAALTTTINTAFGSMVVVPGTGIVLNDEMDDFVTAPGAANVYGLVGSDANAVAPRKRPLSSMSPTIVLRGRKPLLALGASGGPRIISATVEVLLDVVDFGMTLDEAVAAPRIHHQWMPDRLFYEPSLASATVERLRSAGHEMRETAEIGAVQAVLAVPDGFVGVADPRKGGAAVGP